MDYFKDIYSTSFPVDFGANLGAVDRRVSDAMNKDLLSDFKVEEVRRALKADASYKIAKSGWYVPCFLPKILGYCRSKCGSVCP